ncbi:MAG TPA: hypothetical protein VMF05_12005 [Stellaceae bacterium]|nr:hypothetical protein [Stellaceae bacterium]
MPTNADVELELSQAQSIHELLSRLRILPIGYQCEVYLHRGDRKKRRNAEFEANWDADADSIRISFSPMEEEGIETATSAIGVSVETTANPTSAEDRLSDLVRALNRAEGRPGYEFVSLKWFRDNALVHEEFSWARDESARHDVLREAIDRRWLLTSKVANPRPPHFPVTAIRLNRQMPEVNAALGIRTGSPSAFCPVTIRGPSLSATVLRDRR